LQRKKVAEKFGKMKVMPPSLPCQQQQTTQTPEAMSSNSSTFFRLPNKFTATINEGHFTSRCGFEYDYELIVRDNAKRVESTLLAPTLKDCMDYLAQY
jgi:hypothetical protein